MPITFPIPTTIGEQFSSGGKTWKWNGYAWNSVANASAIGATGATGPGTSNAIVGVPSDATPINVIRAITQAQYNAISPKDPNTIYFIVG